MTPITTTSSSSSEKLSNVYFSPMTLVLALIGIKYQSSNTNPFQQSSLSMLLLLTSISCHTIALTAKLSNFLTVIIFHISGVTACETLLWILLPEIWKCVIINVILSLVAAFCFYYTHICELLTKLQGTCFTCTFLLKTCTKCLHIGLDSNPMTDLEAQEYIGAQMEDLTAPNTI